MHAAKQAVLGQSHQRLVFLILILCGISLSSVTAEPTQKSDAEIEEAHRQQVKKDDESCRLKLRSYEEKAVMELIKKKGRAACILTVANQAIIGYFNQQGSMLQIDRPEPDEKIEIGVKEIRKIISNLSRLK